MPTYHAPQNPPVPPSSLTFDLLQSPVKPIHVSLQNSNFPDHPCAYLHRDFPICAKTHDPGVINTNPLAALRTSSKKGTDDWRPGLPYRLYHGFAVSADVTCIHIGARKKKNEDNDLHRRWLALGPQVPGCWGFSLANSGTPALGRSHASPGLESTGAKTHPERTQLPLVAALRAEPAVTAHQTSPLAS